MVQSTAADKGADNNVANANAKGTHTVAAVWDNYGSCDSRGSSKDKGSATTTMRTPCPANATALKAAPASHAHETNYALQDSKAAALRATALVYAAATVRAQGAEATVPSGGGVCAKGIA